METKNDALVGSRERRQHLDETVRELDETIARQFEVIFFRPGSLFGKQVGDVPGWLDRTNLGALSWDTPPPGDHIKCGWLHDSVPQRLSYGPGKGGRWSACYNNDMSQHPDLAILGGGVIGLTTAYYLARAGMSVEVVDKGDFGQEASWAGAGILPPGNLERARNAVERFRALSSQAYPALSAELRERTGQDNGYLSCGGIEFIPEGSEETDEWRSEGVAWENLDAAALAQLEPAVIAPPGTAVHLPGMAQLRNPRHLKALLAGCHQLGVRFRPGCPVLGFEREGRRLQAVTTSQDAVHAGQYILTTGAWSEPLLAQLGWRPGIRPVRGQIVLLNAGRPVFRRILVTGPRYLVPRADGKIVVGSTEEHVGFDKRTTAGAVRDLVELACTLVPELADAQLERAWAGLRPGSPDGLPFLGPVPGFDNLLVAAGHFRAGIQLAPATAQLLKELALSLPLTVPWEPFRLDR